jgi:superfamily II DNA or RNA helicase
LTGDPSGLIGLSTLRVPPSGAHRPERTSALPAPPTVDQLDDHLLEAVYDRGSLARGRAYAEEGRASVLSSEPGLIKAVCRGSGHATYVVRVRWGRRDGGVGIDLDDTCTCPLARRCKHCVAVVVTARREAAEAAEAPAPAADPHPARDWRRALAELSTAEDADDRIGNIGLALQFAVEHPNPTRYSTNTDPRVTVRPMRPGKGGQWIKTGASWRDIGSPHGHTLTDVDPLQRAAVRSVMASGPPDLAHSHIQTAPLALFGPDLWFQLERAVEVGVQLIGEHPGDRVVVSATRAAPGIDLAADGSGDVTLTASFTLDGEPMVLAEGRSGFLGTPPHGLWVRDGGRLELVALTAPLHPTVGRLATAEPLTVPADDVEELLDVYQPALARHATVASSDRSVIITTSRFEGIVLTVERTALDTAALRWSVRYRRGERAVDHPLHGTGGRARDRAAERAAVGGLELPTHLLPTLVDWDGSPRDLTVSGPAILTLVTEVLPWLEAKGQVIVERAGDHPELREASGDPLISLMVTDGDDDGRRGGNDWFDLDVEVSVDGQIIDFVSLFAALARDDEALILPSGTWLRLDRPEFTRLRELIDEARSLADPTGTGAIRLNRFQTSWWDELTGLGVVTRQSQRWADSVGRMAALAAPEPVPVPEGLDATLRHYQQEGLDWLAFLHRNRLGGILADDMGLGKTVQTLALCLHVLQQEPDARFLVVAPTSVVENWAHEAARFAPGVEVRTISETQARRGHSLDDEIDGATIVVTSYALFRLEFESYTRHEWELLLLDEAQFVKNHQGKTYQCARRLDAATKIAITGTPLENTLMDLWSLLSITAPGLYPDPKTFSETFRKPIESGDAPELLATLRRRIAPLMRRRTKEAVLTELPPKTEQTVEIELNARHARIYATQLQRQRQKVLGLVGDVQRNRFEILKSLTILRQLALDPGLVDEADDDVGSAKLDRLVDDLTQVVAEGHRALVFSQFTRYLARVRTRLDAAGITHSYLDGSTRNRPEAIARFKDGDAPVFVISLKAGGFGLNLTEADYCFVLDPWWNPATELQAVDRTHRIGQLNPVMVYRYVSTDTIEEKVMELKARKSDLFNSVLDGEGALAGALTEDDIRGLLDLA